MCIASATEYADSAHSEQPDECDTDHNEESSHHFSDLSTPPGHVQRLIGGYTQPAENALAPAN